MKLLIETSLPKILLILMDEKKVLFSFLADEKKKADLLPKLFKQMIKKTKINASEIKEFYVTTGSGSFMGSRTGITFARTIAQITNAKLFISDPLTFVGFKSDKDIYLDAKTNQSYKYDYKTKTVLLVDYHEDTKINYNFIVDNIFEYLPVFTEKNSASALASYLKDPKIGGK